MHSILFSLVKQGISDKEIPKPVTEQKHILQFSHTLTIWWAARMNGSSVNVNDFQFIIGLSAKLFHWPKTWIHSAIAHAKRWTSFLWASPVFRYLKGNEGSKNCHEKTINSEPLLVSYLLPIQMLSYPKRTHVHKSTVISISRVLKNRHGRHWYLEPNREFSSTKPRQKLVLRILSKPACKL